MKLKARPIFLAVLLCLIYLCLVSPLTPAEMKEANPALVGFPVTLVINGTILPLNVPLMSDVSGHSYIVLSECPIALNCNAIWGEPDHIILENDSISLDMYLESHHYAVNLSVKEMICPPLRDKSGDIWIPLRSAAEGLSYHVDYNGDRNEIMLMSDAYLSQMQESQPLPSMLDVDTSQLGNWGPISGSAFAACLDKSTFLEGYYTRLINSSAPRTANVSLACNALDETILQANEVFSFNQIVGERTTAKGYREAPIFVGQKVVPGVGGGICQTSSTLYNAALQSGLQIVERHPHSMPVAYAPSGRDATVSWNSTDLKIRNNYNSPIRISCKVVKNYVVAAFSKVLP